jgi:pantoate--beta-alanine ligase
MKTITTITDMQSLAESFQQQGKTIGFVPTMGFLHDGHLSLMHRARQENDVVVASIFVNPTQFGPNEDMDRYPRDAEGDRTKCGSAGVDVLFLPQAKDMYPDVATVFVTVEGLSEILEGAVRPGHFRGVATVVNKLFNIVKPQRVYFGQKDYQQCAVIKRMVAGLNMAVEIVVMPTVREPDGLAMSSRNVYLKPEERRAAVSLSRALAAAEQLVRTGVNDISAIKKDMQDIILREEGTKVDYIEIADPDTLAPLSRPQEKMVILLAVRIGPTRLIDNALIL